MNIVFTPATWTYPGKRDEVTPVDPLEPVGGRPLYAWVADRLPFTVGARFVIVGQPAQMESGDFEADLKKRYAPHSPTLVSCPPNIEGEVATVLAAAAHVDGENPLLIHTSPVVIDAEFAGRLSKKRREGDGVLSVAPTTDDKGTFVRIGPNGFLKEAVYRYRVDQWATTGLYYFARTKDFVRVASAAMEDGGRASLALLYNDLIKEGARVVPDKAPESWPLAAPAERSRFEASLNGGAAKAQVATA